MSKSTKWYVADFETTSFSFYQKEGYTKVWLYAICDNDANIFSIGTSIEEFIADCRKLKGKQIYFHNLKFDGSFILDYLLRMGYEYYEDLKDTTSGFTTLIGEMGEFYNIVVKFNTSTRVTFIDSLKLLPFTVEKIAKDFGLPILKLKIDYDDYEITPEKIEYISHDVKIIAMALSQIKAEGMTKNTTASCAYAQYISMRGDNFLYGAFPDLEDSFLEEWRNAYRGGRSQVNPIYKGKIIHNVNRFDINSMYPSIMRYMELPYGKPIPIDKIGEYNFELYHIKVSFVLREYHLPSLLKKASIFAGDDSYYIDSDGVEELWISSIDYELLLRNYDITYIEFINMVGFRTSKLLFFDYIDKWYAKKQHDKGAKKIVDKFMLNCLYGKYGSNNKGYHKIPYIDENMIVSYYKSDIEDMKKYYLPIAIAITSYAHKLLDDAIYDTGIENFVYCDTDSVHTLGTLPISKIDNIELGKFKHEGTEITAKYVRQKCYVYEQYDKNKNKNIISITCAGMTQHMKDAAIDTYKDMIFKVFTTGFAMGGKLIPKRVPGGTVLYETTFEIK